MNAQDNAKQRNDSISLPLLWLLLPLAGFIVSLYATYHHWLSLAGGPTQAICNINQTFSCDAISQSKYSEFLGIPVAIWGVGYFIALMAFWFLYKLKSQEREIFARSIVLLFIAGGVVSLGLAGVSLLAIKVLCPICLIVYLVVGFQIGAMFYYKHFIPFPIFQFKPSMQQILFLLISLVVPIVIYKVVPKPTASHPVSGITENHLSQTNNAVLLSTQRFDIAVSKNAFSGLGEDYRKGPDGAPVVIHKFSDFQCPACQRMDEYLRHVKQEFGDQLQIVYRNFALNADCNGSVSRALHPFACHAAIVARCAGLYGKFWEMHHEIFENQSQLNPENLGLWAKKIGLTDNQINSCYADKGILEKIKADGSVGQKLGVSGTPTLFVNGRQFVGKQVEDLRVAILSFLK